MTLDDVANLNDSLKVSGFSFSVTVFSSTKTCFKQINFKSMEKKRNLNNEKNHVFKSNRQNLTPYMGEALPLFRRSSVNIIAYIGKYKS